MANNQMTYTREGFKALEEELNFLKTTRREEIREQIAVAKSFGDLSENAEYDEARSEQGKNEARIQELENLIENAIIVDESKVDASIVSLGSSVKITNNGKEMSFIIVGSNEVDPAQGKISDQSPIGKALMGKRVGDEFDVDVPVGSLHIAVLEVARSKSIK